MVSSKNGWKKGLLVVAVVCASVFALLIVGAGMVLLWAVSTAARLGEPTAEAVTRARRRRIAGSRDPGGGAVDRRTYCA